MILGFLSGLGSVIISILAFIFVLGAIILIHEGGHFFFAVKGGILCREYAFGMGPLLWHKKKGETQYSLRAFPIGGFCAIAGEEKEDDPLKDKKQVRLVIEDNIVKKICFDVEEEIFNDLPLFDLHEYDLFDENKTGNLYMKVSIPKENEEEQCEVIEYKVDEKAMYIFANKAYKKSNLPLEKKKAKYIEEVQNAPYNRQLNSKSLGRRAAVMVGGILMNMILGFVAFFVAYLITGVSNTSSTMLSDVTEGTPAYNASLRDGDIICGLETTDGKLQDLDISKWDEISVFMASYKERTDVTDTINVYYYENGDTNNKKVTSVKPMTIIYSISMVEDITSDDVKIAALAEKSKAYKAGLREGDIITSVNNVNVSTWKEVYTEFSKITESKQEVSVNVLREGKELSFTVTPYSKKLFERTQSVNYVEMQIGISPTITRNIFKCLLSTFVQMWSSIKQLFFTLVMLIGSSEVGLKDLSGVVGIFSLTSEAAASGFGTLLWWMGFLSVNVGFMNLLPIPALDGGRLLFLGIEWIRKKPVSQKAQDLAINITMYALYALMIYVVINDILRLI